MDINVDAGESYGAWTMGDDAALFAEVSSANLACGFHAGDPGTIRRSLDAALAAGVAIGAHPGLADLPGFGRRGMALTPAGGARRHALPGRCAGGLRARGGHDAAPREAARRAQHRRGRDVRRARGGDRRGRASSSTRRSPSSPWPAHGCTGPAQTLGHPVVAEGFPDRAYAADGSLVRRGTPGALIHDPDLAAERAVRMALQRSVVAIDGTEIEVDVGTLCIHGDNPGSVATARAVRAALRRGGRHHRRVLSRWPPSASTCGSRRGSTRRPTCACWRSRRSSTRPGPSACARSTRATARPTSSGTTRVLSSIDATRWIDAALAAPPLAEREPRSLEIPVRLRRARHRRRGGRDGSRPRADRRDPRRRHVSRVRSRHRRANRCSAAPTRGSTCGDAMRRGSRCPRCRWRSPAVRRRSTRPWRCPVAGP